MLKATRILHHLHSGSNETFRGAGNKRGSSIATRRSTVVLRDVLVRINACTVCYVTVYYSSGLYVEMLDDRYI